MDDLGLEDKTYLQVGTTQHGKSCENIEMLETIAMKTKDSQKIKKKKQHWYGL